METMDFDCTPYDEDSAQVGAADYARRARAEASACIAQVLRMYPVPAGSDARLRIKRNPHDFGTYYSIEGRASDEAGIQWLYLIEENWPQLWDDQARAEIGDAAAPEPEETAAGPVYYANPPKACDLCHAPLGDDMYDQKTTMGPWANLCPACSARHGVGLGLGVGQHYRRQPDGRFLKIAG